MDSAQTREQLEADVLIIGAGPAGLSCAIHLAHLAKADQSAGVSPAVSADNIYVLEKAREPGAHQLSGAILDPRALRELVPDFERPGFEPKAPLDSPVTDDAAFYLTAEEAWRLPITPPPLRNHGNYIVSLNRLVKWLWGLAETEGVNLFTQFAGQELLYDSPESPSAGRVLGVRSGDKGLDKAGKPKPNFTPGYDIHAKITVLAEGPRGSLTKDLVGRLGLDGLNPQVYGLGIKELWEVPPGRIQPGYVAHTLGWPLDSRTYGGGWIYGLTGSRASLGMVVALECSDSLFDPQAAFQVFKTHPWIRRVLEGGKLLRYGAKTLPYGGWYSMPRSFSDGALIIGDSASLLNSQRLKGIHIAMKSGMLAAEAIYESLRRGDTSAAALASYQKRLEQSWIRDELWPVRNFHQAFHGGLWKGLLLAGFQFLTGGRGVLDPMLSAPGHTAYAKLDREPVPVDRSSRFKGDGALTFNRLTDVYHSGTRHDEDQPCHLQILEPAICADRCIREYGNPCQYFCPAAVYEMTLESGAPRLKINAANCVHCKTCDIADPYQIINWVPPEGGGGPTYDGM